MSKLLVQLQDISFRYLEHLEPLFSHAALTLYEGEKVALLGANGAGKSTLLKLIRGDLESDSGSITRSGSLFTLHQDDRLEGEATVLESLLAAEGELCEGYLELSEMEAQGLPDPLLYSERVAGFAERGGFELLQRIEKTVTQFGFHPDTLKRPVLSLSGGERRLLKLASAFLSDADAYILDEPTNYLDEAATEYLIEAIHTSPKSFLIVSHDRYFLDETVTKVLELERGTLSAYGGNFSLFRETKEGVYRQKVRQSEKLEREIGKLKEVERTYKVWGGRKEKEKSGAFDRGFIGARAARLMKRGILAKERIQDRIGKLEKGRPYIDKRYSFHFEEPNVPSGTCLALRDLTKTMGGKTLFEGLSVTLEWGERVAIRGANGSGKSTLIRLLLGELSPDAGAISWGRGVSIGYLPQFVEAIDDSTPIHSLFPEAQHPQARLLMGCLKVKGDTFYKPLGSLSEGQRRKVKLVQLTLQNPNLLILDEPTTHLDYESVEMLEDALLNYPGTLILVSHDRYLLERVTEREIAL